MYKYSIDFVVVVVVVVDDEEKDSEFVKKLDGLQIEKKKKS